LLVGFLETDEVSAVYSRTQGETVLGSPYSISAELNPADVLSNYTITYNNAKLHHQHEGSIGITYYIK
jgi:hypothetical protein